MREFPHHYGVTATARADGDIALDSPDVPRLLSAAPAEFDGPGDRWSPETLLVAAVSDCFILTFRSIAKMSKLPWTSVTCDVSGTLDRVDRVTQFTAFTVRADLVVPAGTSEEQATKLLARAEQHCLISNSLKAHCQFEGRVRVCGEAAA